MKVLCWVALLLAAALVGCDDDTTSTDVVNTDAASETSTPDVAADSATDSETDVAGDTSAGVCLPTHTQVANSSGCLQDDALCYQTAAGDWCTGTLGSMAMAECEAIGATGNGSSIDNTCPAGKLYLGSVWDVNCLCGCCL